MTPSRLPPRARGSLPPMASRKTTPLVPWTELAPHRDEVQLKGTPLLGHLYWWRKGEAAKDLTVPSVTGPKAVDWTGFPAEPPEGYEDPPKRKRSSGVSPAKTQAERTSKIKGVTLTPEARVKLKALAKADGGNESACVERLIHEAYDKK